MRICNCVVLLLNKLVNVVSSAVKTGDDELIINKFFISYGDDYNDTRSFQGFLIDYLGLLL